jgi:hypothetical protein
MLFFYAAGLVGCPGFSASPFYLLCRGIEPVVPMRVKLPPTNLKFLMWRCTLDMFLYPFKQLIGPRSGSEIMIIALIQLTGESILCPSQTVVSRLVKLDIARHAGERRKSLHVAQTYSIAKTLQYLSVFT